MKSLHKLDMELDVMLETRDFRHPALVQHPRVDLEIFLGTLPKPFLQGGTPHILEQRSIQRTTASILISRPIEG